MKSILWVSLKFCPKLSEKQTVVEKNSDRSDDSVRFCQTCTLEPFKGRKPERVNSRATLKHCPGNLTAYHKKITVFNKLLPLENPKMLTNKN